MARTCLFAALAVVAFAGCDSRAKASDPVRAGEKSKEYESCGASAQCQDDLRCFDHVCRRTTRSAVGDYFAALGAQKRAGGDIAGAIEAYNLALGHYDSEKIPLPPDVDCQYGAALAAAKAKKEHAELGARVLHRCILAVPVGSPLRDRALADLATLSDVGLDPLALGRTQLADVYLSRAPSSPSVDKLQVTVTASPPVTGKTYQALPDLIAGADLKPSLVACWQAYNSATHKDAMAVAIPVKSSYIPSEYEDESGVFTLKLDPAVNMPAGPEQAADQCVRAALEPAIKELKSVRDAFQTKLTIVIK
jgi:hypothetical protein